MAEENPHVGYSPGHMQNTPAPAYEDKFFELDQTPIEDMTFDDCEAEIARTNHNSKNPTHPLNPIRSSIDSRKKQFIDRKLAVFEQRNALDETPNPYDIALNEMAVKEQARKDDIHAAGKRDWFKLKEYGYEGGEPPAEISADQARLYRMQVLNSEGTRSGINELGNMVSADMRKYNQTQELSGLFNTLLDTEIDPDLRQQVGHRVIEYLDALRRDSLEKKPTKQTNFNTFKAKHNIEGNTYG